MKFKIRPKEIKTWRYWFHIAVISSIVLILLQLFQGGNMLSIKNILWSIPLIGVADIIAHTILGID